MTWAVVHPNSLDVEADRWCPLCNRRRPVEAQTDAPFVTYRCAYCGFVHKINERKALAEPGA